MKVHILVPILNVSSFAASVQWFEKFGWEKRWDWGEPPVFGCVASENIEIFLAQGAQGGRGKSDLPTTSTYADDDKGCWISLWVHDLDAIHENCLAQGLEVTQPPTDQPWGTREMHVRHPDGHVFRIGDHDEECEEE